MTEPIELSVTQDRVAYHAQLGPQTAFLLLEVLPAVEQQTDSRRPPLNLALVLDRSGSMHSEKLSDLKEAARLTVEQLDAKDIISVVVFDETATTIVPAQTAQDKPAIIASIMSIQERGGTRISNGMHHAQEQLLARRREGYVQRMILLTDGETWQDEPLCRQAARRAGAEGIPISALGLGDEWNQRLLSDIATFSGGEWHYIDQPDRIVDAFQQSLDGMTRTVATHAQLVCTLLPGVTIHTAWRVTPFIELLAPGRTSAREMQFTLGDLRREGQSLLLEMSLPTRAGGRFRLAGLELNARLIHKPQQVQQVQSNVIFRFAPSSLAEDTQNNRVRKTVEKIQAYTLANQALDEQEPLERDARTRRLQAAATRLLHVGEVELAQEMTAAAEKFKKGQSLSRSQTKRLASQTRRLDMRDLFENES